MAFRSSLLALGLSAVVFASFASFSACSSDESKDGSGGGGDGSGGQFTGGNTVGNGNATHAASGNGGSGGEGGAGGSGGAGGAECNFDAPNTCETAEVLQDIQGDQEADVVTLKGNTSEFFQFKVVEDGNVPQLVRFKVTLTSPPGMDYDLIVRQGTDTAPDCTYPPDEGMGNPEVVTGSFSDQIGADDSHVMSVEVRYVEGEKCDEASQWTLKIEGNTE